MKKVKGKAVPLQAWTCPEGSQEVKVPRFRDNGTGWWQVVSLTYWPPLPPGNAADTHFYQRLSMKYGTGENYRILMLLSISTGATFRGVKRSGREPHHSSPSSVQVMNGRRCKLALVFAFMAEFIAGDLAAPSEAK